MALDMRQLTSLLSAGPLPLGHGITGREALPEPKDGRAWLRVCKRAGNGLPPVLHGYLDVSQWARRTEVLSYKVDPTAIETMTIERVLYDLPNGDLLAMAYVNPRQDPRSLPWFVPLAEPRPLTAED